MPTPTPAEINRHLDTLMRNQGVPFEEQKHWRFCISGFAGLSQETKMKTLKTLTMIAITKDPT